MDEIYDGDIYTLTDETGKVIVRAHCVMCFTGKALPL
mgnify:CR=1 FL=1